MRTFWMVVAAAAGLVASNSAWAAIAGLERIASGLNRPVFVTHAPGDRDRLFIVQQDGVIKIWKRSTGTVNSTPFLTVTVHDDGNEEGLLGLAFHPDYQQNGKFYINATIGTNTFTHVREYTVSADPDIANSSGVDVITFEQPQSNHNGGWIGFGPNDGYLYIATGDGGNANDVGSGHTEGSGNAQDITDNLLGKMLRIDVNGDGGQNYSIPGSNPLVGVPGDDEIWAYGLRNPWRNSFDRHTGDLWIGDVGQNAVEEIDYQPASTTAAVNYGWKVKEGNSCFDNSQGGGNPTCNSPSLTDPIYDYDHGSGSYEGYSTVGGYVYRGPDPELQGTYFFADSGSNHVWSFDPESPIVLPPGSPTNPTPIDSLLTPNIGAVNVPVSFGEDADGNLYLVDLGTGLFNTAPNSGDVFRIVTDVLLPGDYDADGDVDKMDYQEWKDAYGTTAVLPDGNKDGHVGAADYTIWRNNLGASVHDLGSGAGSGFAAETPEPVSAVLLGQLLLLTGVTTYRRRHRRL